MRALTVRQPFATRLVNGEKRVENRSMPTSRRGTVAIHAGAQVHDLYRTERISDVDQMPRSAIVGTVELVDCHQAEIGCRTDGVDCSALGGFAPTGETRTFHWVVANPVEWPEAVVDVSGALGFWRWDDAEGAIA